MREPAETRHNIMNAITEKLNRSWQLFKSSVVVIRTHPKLLVFPIVTGLLTLAIALFFLAPVVLVLVAPHWVHNTPWQTLAERFGFFRFTTVERQRAIPAAYHFAAGRTLSAEHVSGHVQQRGVQQRDLMEALAGGGVSIRHGLEAACTRWKSILLWSLLAEQSGYSSGPSSSVSRFWVASWPAHWPRLECAAIFAIPILVRDTSVANPFEVLSKSARP